MEDVILRAKKKGCSGKKSGNKNFLSKRKKKRCRRLPKKRKRCRCKQGSPGKRGRRGPRGCRGLSGPRGVQGKQGAPGPAGPRGPQGERGSAGLPIENFTIVPSARRYFYFAEGDMDEPAVIPANRFTDDSGMPVLEFAGSGINGFTNLFVNGMVQEGRMYSVNPEFLSLMLEQGDQIQLGTPIIIETVQFVLQLAQNEPYAASPFIEPPVQ